MSTKDTTVASAVTKCRLKYWSAWCDASRQGPFQPSRPASQYEKACRASTRARCGCAKGRPSRSIASWKPPRLWSAPCSHHSGKATSNSQCLSAAASLPRSFISRTRCGEGPSGALSGLQRSYGRITLVAGISFGSRSLAQGLVISGLNWAKRNWPRGHGRVAFEVGGNSCASATEL